MSSSSEDDDGPGSDHGADDGELMPTPVAPKAKEAAAERPRSPGGTLAPLPGVVGNADIAEMEALVTSADESRSSAKYAAGGAAPAGKPALVRAASVNTRQASISGAELAGGAQPLWLASNLKIGVRRGAGGAGEVQIAVRDHGDVSVSFWQFHQDKLRKKPNPEAPGDKGLSVGELEGFLESTVAATLAERRVSQDRFDSLDPKEQSKRRRQAGGVRIQTSTCRWFHLPGSSHAAIDHFAAAYRLHETVTKTCKATSGKPICSWHQTSESYYDHLFVAAHYIKESEEQCPDGISAFGYEQVFMVFIPDLNTIISIDANGEKTWEGVTDLLDNERGFVRTNCDTSVLIYKLLDSMIDEVYPLLDLYGDLLEHLEFDMMASPEPTDDHVRTSFKLKRRVHSLRRYGKPLPRRLSAAAPRYSNLRR